MSSPCKEVILLALLTVVRSMPISIDTSQNFTQSTELDKDGKYLLSWTYNETHIVFEVRVQTKGYVGFGLSHNGRMYPSDVVIGWVRDGRTYFSDRHTTAHAPPELDVSQDWFLLHGEETDYETVLRFLRKLDTCDTDDLPINDQTVRLIYSYHPDDPVNETALVYHGGERRGSKSVSILSSSLPPASFEKENVKILEFRNRNYVLPNASTTYYCMGFQLPNLGGKHHMIEYEMVFTPGNELRVHHLTLSRCHGSYPHLDMSGCHDGFPRDCSMIAAWAAGGGPFYFPADAGFPIGGDDFNFYTLNFHYDNPEEKTGIIDSSGFRIKLTSNLRHHDVNSLILSHEVNNVHVIPPGESAFITRGYCAPQCTTTGLQNSTEDVKIIAGLQHSHLLGVGVTTRHFRNGIEIEPLMDDPYYDFFFQSFRPLRKPRLMKPGDSFIVECTYNTMKRSTPAFGGLTTHDEMCMTFLYVYPAPALLGCSSEPLFDNFNLTASGRRRQQELHEKFLKMNWQDQTIKDDFNQKLRDSSVNHICLYMNQGKYTFITLTTPCNEHAGKPTFYIGKMWFAGMEEFHYVENTTPFNRSEAAPSCKLT